MHAERLVKRHRAAHLQDLDAREPALINLPIPIPSNIPLLSPIIDPLVAGIPLTELLDPSATLPPLISLPTFSIQLPTLHTTSTEAQPTSSSPAATLTPVSTSPATTTAPVVTIPPSPTPTPQTTSSPHVSDTPSASKPTVPAPESQSPALPATTPAQTQPSTPSTNNGGGDDQKPSAGSPSNNGDSGSHATSPNAGSNPTSAGNDASPAGHTSPAGAPTAPAPSGETGASSSGAAAAGASGSGTGISLLPTATVLENGSTILSFTLTNGQAIPVPTQKAVANAGSEPSSGSSLDVHFTATSSTITYSAAGSLSTGASGSGDGNGGDGSDGGQNNGNGSGAGASSAGHHDLSTGAIAALAVVGALLLLALVVFSCRRWSIAKRLSRRRRWYGEKSIYGAVSSSGYFRQNPPSARSSFATSFDCNADPFCMDPPPVPLAHDWPLYHSPEMSHTSSMSVAVPSTAATTCSLPSPTLRTGDRSSVGSYESARGSAEGSAHDGQVLLVPARTTAGGEPLTPEPPTPISVRPFSPSERWSFPQPPTLASARHSGAPAPALQPPPRTTSASPASLATYFTAEDPFADPSADGHGGGTEETFVTADSDAAAHFRAVETVRRAYAPLRGDEIAVAPGEAVRVVRRFDDGWAYAENLSRGSRGLFPIDCLRRAHEDLGTFLAEKRLSAYAGVRPPSPVLVHNMI